MNKPQPQLNLPCLGLATGLYDPAAWRLEVFSIIGELGAPSAAAHSGYWDKGNPALADMGKIIVGRTGVTPPSYVP